MERRVYGRSQRNKIPGIYAIKNGGAEKHIRERIRRTAIAMKRTWSIGERIFKEDYRRRTMMFDSLVGSVALFGAEVWGWLNESRMDRIKRKYVKWILNLDARTPILYTRRGDEDEGTKNIGNQKCNKVRGKSSCIKKENC